jgi:ERCC4-type nuclease
MSILIDYKKGAEKKTNTPQEMVNIINRLGVKAEISDLPFGDVCFEGRGPKGSITIGIERKTLHDMLNCIDDARLAGHQVIGMKDLYDVRIVLLEGHWKAHDPEGWLMEGFNGGTSWGHCRYRSQRQLYSKLYRYLISLSLGGMIVFYSRDLWHTCYNVVEAYHYFQKRFDDHTSMQEIQKVSIPTMNFKPSLTRRWAHDLEDVGLKISELAERHFQTPIRLANADESEWLRIPGIGVKTAQKIVREIWGL